MKIKRRNFLLASSAALLASNKLGFGSHRQNDGFQRVQTARRFSTTGKQVTVYTTAAKTDYRISRTAPLSFKPVGQPKETQICVFVDPSRQFQTFLGIGVALTDASAETFALFPKEKEREFLSSYFENHQGIVYMLARTNMHCSYF